ncbi:MAG: lamin tail domain-containing protein, partial [Saprospiraceae bacterium]|nr:lamin tail domain-containing protein [Saprospiraceae bacterium]
QILSAQILDNFSDGNFDQNPAWVGDAANFIVNTAGELQLNATAAGQSVLLTSGNIPDSTIWEFDVRLAFDPSNQNLVRIYLQLDQTDLLVANGYYLEMGETGSADAIRFFRQDAGVKALLATGQPGLAASTPNLHFRVTRSSSGLWTLEAASVGTALQPQFSLSENTWPGGLNRFFGFQCVYTISNATRFYFDNVNIRPDVPDTQPPVLVSAQANNPSQVTVVFNENLELASAENPAHYTINNSIGQPLSATLSPDQKTVTLGLQNLLATGTYTVQTSGVKDLFGNESGVQTTDFQYVKIDIPVEFDIIITEIMADPTPGVGLPEVEWLEIFNRSNKVFDLAKVRFNDATGAPVTLPSYLLQANEYVVLAATANAPILQSITTG